MVTVRPETDADSDAVYRVNREASGQEAEARLVEVLRAGPTYIPELSIVAVDASGVVGHILFSSITVRDGPIAQPALALAPMAVLPALQNRGIGSQLVRYGLDAARELGHRIVIVLGHPKYYSRFEFQPAEAVGIRAPFPVPADAFLVIGLQEGAVAGVQGVVEYPPGFSQV
jgi:putative acetyltransferase